MKIVNIKTLFCVKKVPKMNVKTKRERIATYPVLPVDRSGVTVVTLLGALARGPETHHTSVIHAVLSWSTDSGT